MHWISLLNVCKCLFLAVLEPHGIPVLSDKSSGFPPQWLCSRITLLLMLFLTLFLFILFRSFRSEAKKTKVKKKTNNPHFDEVFYFEVGISKEWVISWNTILWIVGMASCSVLCQLSSLKTVSKHGAGGRSTQAQTGRLLKEQYPAFTSGTL